MPVHKHWCALLMLTAIPAAGQEDEPPELDFLEYLGSWQAEDETWFVDVEIETQEEEDEDADRRRAQNETD